MVRDEKQTTRVRESRQAAKNGVHMGFGIGRYSTRVRCVARHRHAPRAFVLHSRLTLSSHFFPGKK
jgi:hypothetical protein